jgi:inositol phosphorylceramide mannosyltransferase catalytic subunit
VATNADSDTIPKRIFQTWKSKTDLPRNFAYWRSTFLDKNTCYHFDLWDDADNRAFIARHFEWFLRVYDSYPAEIYRADIVRYFYLYIFGGLYADLDTQCLKPLDAVLARNGVVLGRMGANEHFDHSVPNAIMASSPREEFWLYVIGKAMVAAERPSRPEETTGPVLLKGALDSYRRNSPPPAKVIGLLIKVLPAHLQPKPGPTAIHILPSEEWYPVAWADKQSSDIRSRMFAGELLSMADAEKLFPNSSLVTFWTYSWFVGPRRRPK